MKQPHFYSTSYKTGPLRPIFGFVNFLCVFLRTYKETSGVLIACVLRGKPMNLLVSMVIPYSEEIVLLQY